MGPEFEPSGFLGGRILGTLKGTYTVCSWYKVSRVKHPYQGPMVSTLANRNAGIELGVVYGTHRTFPSGKGSDALLEAGDHLQ